jgi:hypothetical protein
LRTTAQLFRVLDLTHEAVVDGVPATKRWTFFRRVLLLRLNPDATQKGHVLQGRPALQVAESR